MKTSRAILALWCLVIVVLVVLEFAEVTHFFTFPISDLLGDPITLVVSLVFVTVVAIVGALFVGIYTSTRLLRVPGFTPFEEEMLRLRDDIRELRRAVDDLRERSPPISPGPPTGPGGR